MLLKINKLSKKRLYYMNDYLCKSFSVSNYNVIFFDENAFIFDENIYICDE